MKKQQSATQSDELLIRLQKDYDVCLGNVKHLEENGQTATYYHVKAARLKAEIETLQGANKKSEVKDNGTSN